MRSHLTPHMPIHSSTMAAVFRRRSSILISEKRGSSQQSLVLADVSGDPPGPRLSSTATDIYTGIVDNVGVRNLATLSDISESIICEELEKR